jgi:hypothetical protein
MDINFITVIMRTKEEYIKLLEETVNFYAEDPGRRGYSEENKTCYYLTSDGKSCAVGRCMNRESLNEFGDMQTEFEGLSDEVNGYHNVLFKEEYKGFHNQFWSDLQTLHDTSKNWGSNGLTASGEKMKNTILHIINSGAYEKAGDVWGWYELPRLDEVQEFIDEYTK